MKEVEVAIDEDWQILLPREVVDALSLQSGASIVWSINESAGQVRLRKSLIDASHDQPADD
ncbi:hypothetical protein [Allohahella marinimesophila]|uniref:AbrB/MazE/SpoVT family DNA-binding domain-containing protein n=1 Tax=Allohahella marinimesophila TaxID=1054972 RepID=A0ABP7NSV8_9GAMM